MKNKDIFKDLDKKVLAGIKLEVFDDRLGRKLLQLYHRGILDPWTIGQINSRVDKALLKEVKTGLSGNEYFEIEEGIEQGDEIIISDISSFRKLEEVELK